MIEFIYRTLAALGYTHPLHPVAVHIPMGMVMGGFLFRAFSRKRPDLRKTAQYCFVLALLFIPPVALLGILDWQHRMNGYWSQLIIEKMSAGAVLTALLAAAVAAERSSPGGRASWVLSALSLIAVLAVGYFGGQLVYG